MTEKPSVQEVDRIIGGVLRRELIKRGYMVVPIVPTDAMHAQQANREINGRFGWTFSWWALLPMWWSMLVAFDPDVKARLDDLAQQLDAEWKAGERQRPERKSR